jgi:uncharacterized membrane protein YbaN (DUF454 family)
MKKKSKYFYLILGHFFLFLTVLGILLPIVPATPFALLAAWFYKRGSSKMHQWITSLKYVGPMILDWDQKKVISLPSKIMALVILFISYAAILFLRPLIPLPAKIMMGLVFSLVARFIIYQKSRI